MDSHGQPVPDRSIGKEKPQIGVHRLAREIAGPLLRVSLILCNSELL